MGKSGQADVVPGQLEGLASSCADGFVGRVDPFVVLVDPVHASRARRRAARDHPQAAGSSEPGLMERPPRPRTTGILTRAMLVRAWLWLGH